MSYAVHKSFKIVVTGHNINQIIKTKIMVTGHNNDQNSGHVSYYWYINHTIMAKIMVTGHITYTRQ